MHNIVVFSKIGSSFNRPDWRFYIFKNPHDNFNPNSFNGHLRTEERKVTDKFWNTFHGSYLKRFVDRSKSQYFRFNTKLSDEGQALFDGLDDEQKQVFLDQQRDQLKNEGLKRMTYTKDPKLGKDRWMWRLKYVDRISDEYFRKIIKHYTNVEFDQGIDEAAQIKADDDSDAVVRGIGYFIYLDKPIVNISHRTRFKIRQIESLKKLFFDFSNAPKETIANASYLRQLVNNNIVTETDFNTFKIVNQLGEIGLKAKSDIKSLNEVEVKFLRNYLGKCVLEKVFDLDQSVRSSSDARAFVSVANSFSNIQLEQDKLAYLKARVENETAKTDKIRGEISAASSTGASTDAQTLSLIDEIYNNSMKNNPPPIVKSLDDIIKD